MAGEPPPPTLLGDPVPRVIIDPAFNRKLAPLVSLDIREYVMSEMHVARVESGIRNAMVLLQVNLLEMSAREARARHVGTAP